MTGGLKTPSRGPFFRLFSRRRFGLIGAAASARHFDTSPPGCCHEWREPFIVETVDPAAAIPRALN